MSSEPKGGDARVARVGDEDLARQAKPGYQTAIRQANQTQSELHPLALNLAQRQLKGDFLRPESNPGYQGVVDSILKNSNRQFTESIAPSINNNAFLSGNLGGGRHGQAIGRAAGDVNQNTNDLVSQLAFSNYGRERALQQTAGQLPFGINSAYNRVVGGTTAARDQVAGVSPTGPSDLQSGGQLATGIASIIASLYGFGG